MLRIVVALVVLATASDAFLFGSGDKWDDLKTTWGLNPFSSVNYHSQPRTESDAVQQGFNKISDCSTHPNFAGKRYVKDNDYSLVLMYDVNGYISGMQIAVPKGLANGYPHAPLVNHPWIAEGNKWFLTAYFSNPGLYVRSTAKVIYGREKLRKKEKPATICTTGRTSTEFNDDGTGHDLYIQNGTNPATDSFMVPHLKTDMLKTKWTEGKCFLIMGDHFWYNISPDMSCDNFFPVFILYNSGKLNAFGWALNAPFSSNRMEHPPQSALSAFFKSGDQPTCLSQQADLSTLHIYLTSTPALDNCG